METLILATGLIVAQADDGGSGAGGLLSFLLIVAVLGGFFWFLIIRPQRSQLRRRQELSAALEIGDSVRTGGGIMGVVRRIDDDSVVLEVEDGGLLRVLRMAVVARDGDSGGPS